MARFPRGAGVALASSRWWPSSGRRRVRRSAIALRRRLAFQRHRVRPWAVLVMWSAASRSVTSGLSFGSGIGSSNFLCQLFIVGGKTISRFHQAGNRKLRSRSSPLGTGRLDFEGDRDQRQYKNDDQGSHGPGCTGGMRQDQPKKPAETGSFIAGMCRARRREPAGLMRISGFIRPNLIGRRKTGAGCTSSRALAPLG